MPAVDYRKLLIHYIPGVVECEGVFLDPVMVSDEAAFDDRIRARRELEKVVR